jgi:hypothetical protein
MKTPLISEKNWEEMKWQHSTMQRLAACIERMMGIPNMCFHNLETENL